MADYDQFGNPIMNNKGLPSDMGKQFSYGTGQIPPNAVQPGMVYTGDNINPDVGINSRETEELTSLKLDGARILDSLQHSLMGFIYDPGCNKWKKVSEPLISPAGVGRLVQILSFSIGNVDHRLSKWGIDSVNESLMATRRNLRHELMLNPIFRFQPNEPLSVSVIRIVLEEVFECKESLLKRSLDGFTVRETGHSETHQFVHNPQQQSGFFPNIFRR